MLTLGSLFSGFGLLDLGLERAGLRTVWHAETDSSAARVLALHWSVPNLGDVTAVDWSAVERPDVLAGGFPCPPFSSAGKRLGRDDPRYLWPEVARAVRDLRPRAVLLENVAPLLTADRGRIFGDILGDLAEAGFDAKWTCIRASDVGAPHRRERVFVAAYGDGWGREVGTEWQPGESGVLGELRDDADGRGDSASHASGESRREVARGAPGDEGQDGPHEADVSGSGGEAATDPGSDGCSRTPPPGGVRSHADRSRSTAERGCGATASDADRTGPEGRRLAETSGFTIPSATDRWGQYAAAVNRWERVIGERVPDPLDTRSRLNVELPRWMMGAPPGWHGDLSRTAAMRGYGNGVVTVVAQAMGEWLLEGMP